VALDGSGARWTGSVAVTAAPNGVAMADAVMTGDGDAVGYVIRFRFLTDDGQDWGLLGWIEESR
jgi:hypothetical protein